MNLTLHVWRQQGPHQPGRMVQYAARDIYPDMSVLEMLDVVNQGLAEKGEEPIAFDSDCREGICGSCDLMINGRAHGPERGVASCQTYMRNFKDGDTIYIEPWRARAFPLVKDLVVDRSALDRIIQAGGFVSINTGGAQDGNCLPVPKPNAESRDGRGGVHWLRRLRGGVQERLGHAVHGRKGLALGPFAAGRPGTAAASATHGATDGRGRFRQLHELL